MTSDELSDAWRANNVINLELLDLCPDELLELKPGKGKTIRSNFVHIVGFRAAWMQEYLRDEAAGAPKLDWKTATREEIREALTVSQRLMDRLFRKMQEPKKQGRYTLIKFFAYCVAHEANHRAQIEIALRINGHEPEDAVLYRLWEWNKK